MRVYQIVVFAVVTGTLIPVGLHYDVHHVWNVHQMGLAFFLWLNTIICFWEICLLLKIDLIEEEYARFQKEYEGRELHRVKDYCFTKVPFTQILAPCTWSQIWSSYALFDSSYANRRSYGFFIDIGNGFTAIVPSLLFLYGMTFHFMPARVLGFVGLLSCYQMWYGTLIYYVSYVKNKRHEGKLTLANSIVVALLNGPWFTFAVWGMWAAGRLIVDESYDVFLR